MVDIQKIQAEIVERLKPLKPEKITFTKWIY